MALDTEQKTDAAAREAVRPTDPSQTAARDRRAVRAEDLSEDAIAALEASQMEGGFEHLDAEFDPAGACLVDVSVDFARKLRAYGDAAKGRPADKAFRDRLFDYS